MTDTNRITLLNQLQGAAANQGRFVSIIAAVGHEDLPPERWAEEIRFETNLAASGLSRSAIALEILKSSKASDADLDIYNARINRTCPLKHYPSI